MNDRLPRTARIVSAAIVFLAGMTTGGEVLLLAMGMRLQLVPALLALVFTVIFLLLARLVLRSVPPGGGRARVASRPATPEILAVCAYCRKVLDDGCRWLPFEDYMLKHSGTKCSHGICPECIPRLRS